MDQFLTIGIVGAILSFVIESLKAKYGEDNAKYIAIALSLVVGIAYWYLANTEAWKAVLGILASATLMYQYVIKPVNE